MMMGMMIKSINVVRDWDGCRLPLHSESVAVHYLFFGFHLNFILSYFVPFLSYFPSHHLKTPLRLWPGLQELTP